MFLRAMSPISKLQQCEWCSFPSAVLFCWFINAIYKLIAGSSKLQCPIYQPLINAISGTNKQHHTMQRIITSCAHVHWDHSDTMPHLACRKSHVQHKGLGCRHAEYPVWDYCLKGLKNMPWNWWLSTIERSAMNGRDQDWCPSRQVSTMDNAK